MGQKQTKAIILKGRGDNLAYWKPQRTGRRAFRFDGMFTRETCLTFARAAVPAANANRVPACAGATSEHSALIILQDILHRRGA